MHYLTIHLQILFINSKFITTQFKPALTGISTIFLKRSFYRLINNGLIQFQCFNEDKRLL